MAVFSVGLNFPETPCRATGDYAVLSNAKRATPWRPYRCEAFNA
jgi:hypothetical protein